MDQVEPLRAIALLIVLCLFASLLLGPIGRNNVSAQSVGTPQERLSDAFRAARDAGLHGVSRPDIAELVSELNQALDLLQHRNDSMSSTVSGMAESRAQALQGAAQDQALRFSILVYAVAFLAAVISAIVVMESYRISRRIRRLTRTSMVQR